MQPKPFYESKTLWINLIAVLGDAISHWIGHPLPAGWDLAVLSGINMVLRIVTKHEITWNDPAK